MNLRSLWPFSRKTKTAEPLHEAPSLDTPKPEPIRFGRVVAQLEVMEAAKKPQEPIFCLPEPAPGVVPPGSRMAMDSAPTMPPGLYAYANQFTDAYDEGLAFPGFSVLSQMCLRSEYRRPSEILAGEMTRNWGEVTYADDKDASEKLQAIEEELDRLKVREAVRKILELDGEFGGGHLYIDTGASEKPEELLTPLALTPAKIAKDSLKAITPVEPIWVYPGTYNSVNPLAADFFKPQTWYVNGINVHRSRLLTVVSRPVPDLLKPAYSFRGLSLSQLGKPYVDNWLETRQGVNDIIQKFSTSVLGTDLNALTQSDELAKRLQAFVLGRNNAGVLAIDMASEKFENVSAPISGLDKLQAQAQEHQAACFGIPLIKLFGIVPTGLNADASGGAELQTFHESLSSAQETVASPVMKTILDVIQLSKFGEIDPAVGWKWHPLKHLDKLEAAQVAKTEAETDQLRIDSGVIDPSEARSALASDDETPYPGLDPNAIPEPRDNDPENDDDAPRGEGGKE